MAISRAQMRQQVSKPGMKKIKKVASALRKASKKHANQAKKLTGIINGRSKKKEQEKSLRALVEDYIQTKTLKTLLVLNLLHPLMPEKL